MTTASQKELVQRLMMQLLPRKTFAEAQNLLHRYQGSKALRLYMRERTGLVFPAVLVFLLVSLACTAATVVFLLEASELLILPAVFLLPVVLVGSFFVQMYLFFSWVEDRALNQALGNRRRPQGAIGIWVSKKTGMDLGILPNVPWALTAVVLFAPLLALASVSRQLAFILVFVLLLVPVAFAFFDR
jgi:hypothetical protein